MDVAHVIQTAVAPVFLLSGVGVTLGVLTNRLTRIVDRARSLESLVGHSGELATEELHRQLLVLARRAGYINTAITMCAVSALMVAMVVMALFASAFFLGTQLSGVIAILFVGAMLCLTAAFGAFLIEVRLAIATLRIGAAPHPS